MTPQGPSGNAQRYRLESPIATGGMGQVWRATDTVLGREVAVKVLRPEYADDPTFRARFEAEARHAAALHHPNVATVFDFGEMPATDGSGSPRPFLVMELVPGEPLSTLLRTGEPMSADIAAELVAQAADALAAAHALGIVHRDVKPGNVLVTPEGQVKIADFGIARVGGGSELTLTGQLVGTPHYLSPEQVDGASATSSSDIYALGVVLYECLTGRKPFPGDTMVTTALAHLRQPVPAMPDTVPGWLQAVVAGALAKDPLDRFASAAELATALRVGQVEQPPALAAAGGTQLLPAPALPSDRRRRSARWPWLAAVAGVLLVVGLLTRLGADTPVSSAEPGGGDSTAARTGEETRQRVRRADYVGLTAQVARERLTKLGLDPVVRLRGNPGTRPEGVVIGVGPVGLVAPDTTITVIAWGPPPAGTPDRQHAKEDQPDKSVDTPAQRKPGKQQPPGKSKGKNQP